MSRRPAPSGRTTCRAAGSAAKPRQKTLSLWEAWTCTAAREPGKSVVIDTKTHREITAQELHSQAESFANKLGNKVKNRIVAFSLPNGVEWFVTFLALQKLGAAAAPMDSTLPPEARAPTARQLGASYLLEGNKLKSLSKKKSSGLSPSYPPATCNQQPLTQITVIKSTSGSTGNLKAIACTSSELLADGRNIVETMTIRPEDRNLALIPLGHSYGLGNLVLPLILQGTAVVCAPQFVPREILSLVRDYRITIFPSVPTIFRILAELEGGKLPPLRIAISAGAVLSKEIATKFHARYGILIHNFYGSSETGGICYDRTGRATLGGRSVGKPLEGVRVTVRKTGLIQVQSPAVSSSLHPAGKSSCDLPDLGKFNRHGELQLMGRTGSLANIGGRKVSPAEIEGHLRQTKGVTDAWVTILRDSHGRDCLGAAIETKSAITQIEKNLERNLAKWKHPKKFIVRPLLPRTERGKLDTKKLQTLFGT